MKRSALVLSGDTAQVWLAASTARRLRLSAAAQVVLGEMLLSWQLRACSRTPEGSRIPERALGELGRTTSWTSVCVCVSLDTLTQRRQN